MAETAKARIFIVEDETFLRELYEELLSDEGYQIESAEDGAKALDKGMSEKFDLTLLDIMLPEMDGFGVMEELKNAGKLENLGKVVMLTNLGQDALVKRGFELGAVGYLIKSAYTPDQILSEVAKFLEG